MNKINTRVTIHCIILIVVIGVLHLTARRNMRFFYQCRCSVTAFRTFHENVRNNNQFDTCT